MVLSHQIPIYFIISNYPNKNPNVLSIPNISLFKLKEEEEVIRVRFIDYQVTSPNFLEILKFNYVLFSSLGIYQAPSNYDFKFSISPSLGFFNLQHRFSYKTISID